MKIIQGDLIKLAKQGEFDVVVHGCNCFNTMGKGIALNIKREFPLAYKADLQTEKGSYDKLGNYSFAEITRTDGSSLMVINAYTQYTYWDTSVPMLFEYEAFKQFLERCKGIEYSAIALEGKGYRWGFPLIGCGLAGGDKVRILKMIEESLEDMDVTVVEFNKYD